MPRASIAHDPNDLMAIPNVIALYILGHRVKREIEGYVARIRSGAIRRVGNVAGNAE